MEVSSVYEGGTMNVCGTAQQSKSNKHQNGGTHDLGSLCDTAGHGWKCHRSGEETAPGSHCDKFSEDRN
jgi:hypothetical protein